MRCGKHFDSARSSQILCKRYTPTDTDTTQVASQKFRNSSSPHTRSRSGCLITSLAHKFDNKTKFQSRRTPTRYTVAVPLRIPHSTLPGNWCRAPPPCLFMLIMPPLLTASKRYACACAEATSLIIISRHLHPPQSDWNLNPICICICISFWLWGRLKEYMESATEKAQHKRFVQQRQRSYMEGKGQSFLAIP